MPVTHEELMVRLPKERQARIKARAPELRREVEGLKALRKLARRSQEQIAQSLGVNYNWHRPHGSLQSMTPISRLTQPMNNLLRLHT